jgi:predicted nucleic acid-binding protein
MSVLLDSSVLVAALMRDEDWHAECLDLLLQGDCVIYAHALMETFTTLTGGRLGSRVNADFAAQLLNQTIRPRVQFIELNADELLEALQQARQHGVRGGAVYDYAHLVAARKSGAAVIYTLNLTDFQALRRTGDPEIRRP